MGNISFGPVFVIGKNLVPNPATGKTAVLIVFIIQAPTFSLFLLTTQLLNRHKNV